VSYNLQPTIRLGGFETRPDKRFVYRLSNKTSMM